jgi:Bacteriophage tail sheath protein
VQCSSPNNDGRGRNCDSATAQDDTDRGTVNVLLEFAALKPAEFVITRVEQLAGETPA